MQPNVTVLLFTTVKIWKQPKCPSIDEWIKIWCVYIYTYIFIMKVAQSCPTFCSPWNSPGQTRVGSLSLLQRIFPTQGSNPGLPHCRQILYQLSHKGSHIHYTHTHTHNEILFVVVQLLSHGQLFANLWTVAWQAPLSFTLSQSLLKFMFIESVMTSPILSSVMPFFCLQSFPASGYFPMSCLFPSSSQSIGASASASVLLMNIHG